MKKKPPTTPFHSSRDEVEQFEKQSSKLKAHIPHLKLAFTDKDFLLRNELRPVRLQLELLRPELVLTDHKVDATIVFFGSARTPDIKIAKRSLHRAEIKYNDNPESSEEKRNLRIAKNIYENSLYLQQATNLAKIISNYSHVDFCVQTGGGPGFMRAANRGAHESNARSISLSVMLPHEQIPNEFVSPELTFQFHYFAIRKMHFLLRAKALVIFPGGFGTMDELFETLTLIQTEKIKPMPVLLFHKKFWQKVVNFKNLVEQGTISPEDLDMFHYVETAEEAWQHIVDFYDLPSQ